VAIVLLQHATNATHIAAIMKKIMTTFAGGKLVLIIFARIRVVILLIWRKWIKVYAKNRRYHNIDIHIIGWTVQDHFEMV